MKKILFTFFLILNLSCKDVDDNAKIKLGTNIWPGYELIYLAREKEYLPGKLSILEFDNATQVINGFKNGIIDVAALTIDEVLNLASTHLDLKILLICDYSNGADALVAKNGISKISDIKGKKIGVENTALGGYFLSRILDLGNLSESDIEIVHTPIDSQVEEYKKNKFDAVVTFDPVKSELIRLGAREIASSAAVPNEIIDVLVVRRSTYEKNKEYFSLLYHSWFRALEFMQTNKVQSLAIMATREKLSVREFENALKSINIPDEKENYDMIKNKKILKNLSRIHDYMQSKKLIARPVDLESLLE